MSRFKEIFKENRKVVLPIIIAESFDIARDKTQIAKDAGADGIFLQKVGPADFAEVNGWAGELRKNSDLFIGIYHPETQPTATFLQNNLQSSGILVDDLGIRESVALVAKDTYEYSIIPKQADETKIAKEKNGYTGLLFVGINLRHQPLVVNLGIIAKEAPKYADVIVSSNKDPDDIVRIRALVGPRFPIAVLDVHFRNINDYLKPVDCFIVKNQNIVIRDFVSAVKASL